MRKWQVKITAEYCEGYIVKTEDFFKWILEQLKNMP